MEALRAGSDPGRPDSLLNLKERVELMWEALEEALQAAEAGDVLAEERSLNAGAQIADSLPSTDGQRFGEHRSQYDQRVQALLDEGKLRRTDHLGTIGAFFFFCDRILVLDGSQPYGSAYLVDENVHERWRQRDRSRYRDVQPLRGWPQARYFQVRR